MKKFLLNLLIPILTFGFGVGTYRIVIPKITLAELSNNISSYDQRIVEIETFVLLDETDGFLWSIYDFDQKSSALTLVYIEDNQIKPHFLQKTSDANFSDKKAKRVKVLIKGKVLDNCHIDGRPSCCLFKAVTIKAQEVKQLEPVEDYTMPE